MFGQLINQGALPCAGRTRQAENACLACVGKKCFQQICGSLIVVLHYADGARQGTRIAITQAIDPGLEI
jgi:hypothetical protein